jgi:predicted helicase
MTNAVQIYLKNIQKEISSGKAQEHAYRPALKTLLESFQTGILATNEPRRENCGAPDFIVQQKNIPLGYVECKDIGTNLDIIEKSEQLQRYFQSLANLILTDYLEFRYYVQGEHKLSVRLGTIDKKGKIHGEKDSESLLLQLIDTFLSAQWPSVGTPKDLAARMAKMAQLIRDIIKKALETESEQGKLHQQLEGFRDVLLHDLTQDQFADMYAQTICYGLFAARCNVEGNHVQTFSREHAAYDLPKTNPFLRTMFIHIAGPELDECITWAVDDLAVLLRRADIARILEDFGMATRQEDPVVHFYETFLAQYDPNMRESRGVYYTPEPVVSYIVRSIDHILKTDFNLKDGLADSTKIKLPSKNFYTGKKQTTEVHKVQILDPAVGTGTFLHGVIRQIYEKFIGNEGLWSGYVDKHLLPRLYGFELLMAPYAVAHMKLGLLLKETGYDFTSDKRLNVFLTNTLEEAHPYTDGLFATLIAEEANRASDVKKDAPVMVVLGNPPYSVSSQNKGDYINRLMDSYKAAVRNERNIQPLSDDYIKFIRFAQHRIETTGYGIVAMITNNSFLSGLIHRGMREELLKTFDKIYLLNLHGNSLIGEVTPEGELDKNVFDIRQGVCISVYVKKNGRTKINKVNYSEIYGNREAKYFYLLNNDVSTTCWRILKSKPPNHFFVVKGLDGRAEYERWWNVSDIFKLNSSGIKTHRDHLVIDFDMNRLKERILDFRNEKYTEEELKKRYVLKDNKLWSIQQARKKIRLEHNWEQHFNHCLYRPFDIRYIFYSNIFIDRARTEVMRNMVNKNMALVTVRQLAIKDFYHVFTTKYIGDGNAISLNSREYNYYFPLYIYNTVESGEASFFAESGEARESNLSDKFIAYAEKRINLKFISEGKGDLVKSQSFSVPPASSDTTETAAVQKSAAGILPVYSHAVEEAVGEGTFCPEDIFHYIYAVLHSPTYRQRYAEFLIIDFPRVPLTSDLNLFRILCQLGEELVGLHLLEKIPKPFAMYPIPGDNIVEKPRYTEPKNGSLLHSGRVWINKNQYFEGVPPDVWDFHIGGYQVCHKWLKDRKDRQLSYDDINHYRNIVTALNETIRIMNEIDQAIPQWPIE